MAENVRSGGAGRGGDDIQQRAREAVAFGRSIRPDLADSVPRETAERIAAQMLRNPELLAEFENVFHTRVDAARETGIPSAVGETRSSGWEVDAKASKASKAAAAAAAGVAALAAGPAGAAAVVAA